MSLQRWPQPISAYMYHMCEWACPLPLVSWVLVFPLPPASVPGRKFVPQILSSPGAISMFSEVSKNFWWGREEGNVSCSFTMYDYFCNYYYVSLEFCLVHSRCSVKTHWINKWMLITSLNVRCIPGTILNSLQQPHKVVMLVFPILSVRKLRQREP